MIAAPEIFFTYAGQQIPENSLRTTIIVTLKLVRQILGKTTYNI